MPYKLNEGRRHKFPEAKYRVTNWPDYDAALVWRGELTVWRTEAAWHAPGAGERGGQPNCSAIAIAAVLTLRLVFHQPLRQTEPPRPGDAVVGKPLGSWVALLAN